MTGVWVTSLLLSTLAALIGASLPLEDAKASVDQLFTYQLDPVDFPVDSIIKVSPLNHCYCIRQVRVMLILNHVHSSLQILVLS